MVVLAHVAHGSGRWLEMLVFVAAAVVAVAWGIGQWRLGRRGGTHGSRSRVRSAVAGAAGWAVLLAALSPVIDRLSAELFSAHMLQHELVMVAAVPLLVASRPLPATLWGLPPGARARAAAALRARGVQRVAELATRPGPATALHAVAIWCWHVPAAWDAATANGVVHVAQHAAFAVTAACFWWAVLVRSATRRALSGAALGAVLVTMLHTTVLGALLTLSPTVIYGSYLASSAAHGLSALADQQLGGLVMWVPGGLAYVTGALAIVARSLDVGNAGHARPVMGVTAATDLADTTRAGAPVAPRPEGTRT